MTATTAITTATASAPAAVPEHAGQLAATYCLPDWPDLIDRIAGLDYNLARELVLSSVSLAWFDHVAQKEVDLCRKVLDLLGAHFEGQWAQLADAEEALAQHGYLHPSHAGLLGAAARDALTDRHKARGKLTDLLCQARTLLDDAI